MALSGKQIRGLNSGTTVAPALTSLFPYQAPSPATTDPYPCTLQQMLDTYGIPRTVKVSISSAEMLALNTTPKVLVAAPGAGYYIRVIGFTCVLNYNSVAYSGNAMVIHHTGSSANLLSSSFYTIGAEYMTFINPSSPSNATLTIIENSSLIAEIGTANPASGNSTVDIYVTYSIIPV